jgi:hypothetical protein
VEPDVVGGPVIFVIGEIGAIDEGGSEGVFEEISCDDGVEDFVEGFDGGMVEMTELQREGGGEDDEQKRAGSAPTHERSFQSW